MKCLVFFLVAINFVFAQNPPADFKLEGTTGGTNPSSISESITILANGQVKFVKITGDSYLFLVDTSFSISSSNVQQIWQAVQNNNFFSLNTNYKDDSIMDGPFALFTITANAVSKQVKVNNSTQQEIQDIISSINSNVPTNFNLEYTPPEIINIVPHDPCNSIIGSSFPMLKNNFSKVNLDKLVINTSSINSVESPVQIPHAGVEIGYQESLYDAVGNGTASLKGKGGYYGDDVSITGDNYNNFNPPENNTIHIKLNLEFYGPCDNRVNEYKIVKDIFNKWDGLITSDGKKIKIDITSISRPGTSLPPGTPGFDDINLACGDGESLCDNLGTPNEGVVGATWYPSDNQVGTFGHEAGHLMGLDDQYAFYDKQSDGTWKNANDETSLSGNDFADLFNSRTGSQQTAEKLAKFPRWSLPNKDHEHDLMARVSQPPLQSDIDDLASNAGLIINIKPGDILVNIDNSQQNFVVSHSEDLFLKPGEIKTLNGIYAACIDESKSSPQSSAVFSVAPSLDKWNGINSAQSLLKVVQYIDSLVYYCDRINYGYAQQAIWKITDNAPPTDVRADSLLMNVGVNINQSFDFPKMTYDLLDSTSSRYIPDQLFAANIEPKYTDAKLNVKTNFTASVSAPSVGNFKTNFTWVLNSPNSNSDQLAVDGATSALTPLQRGVYALNLNVNVKDSTGPERDFESSTYSYAVVADNYTETFEHNNLTDIFSWKTYGDAPWKISNKKPKQECLRYNREILHLTNHQL